VTDKEQRRSESRKLAIVDLIAVSHIAQVLPRMPRGGQVALLVGGTPYEDPYLLNMLETGLAVTYARLFTKSQRYTPVPREWVPNEHDDLHEQLMDRRNRYHAHIDADPANLHRRRVSDAGEGWFAVGFPDPLTPAQLDELVELARKLRRRVDAELALEEQPDDRTVHTPVTPGETKTPD
jgi:hypothetical protein